MPRVGLHLNLYSSIAFAFVVNEFILAKLLRLFKARTKYSPENEMNRKVVTVKSSQTFLVIHFIYFIVIDHIKMLEINDKDAEFGSLHGSENAPFVYTLYVEYSTIWQSTWINDILGLIIYIICQKEIYIFLMHIWLDFMDLKID